MELDYYRLEMFSPHQTHNHTGPFLLLLPNLPHEDGSSTRLA